MVTISPESTAVLRELGLVRTYRGDELKGTLQTDGMYYLDASDCRRIAAALLEAAEALDASARQVCAPSLKSGADVGA